MPKKIKNPIEVRATIHFGDGVGDFTIADVSIHNGLACEHGDLPRSGMALEKNQEILNIVKDFLEEAIKQREVAEQIPTVDSALDDGDAHYVPDPGPE